MQIKLTCNTLHGTIQNCSCGQYGGESGNIRFSVLLKDRLKPVTSVPHLFNQQITFPFCLSLIYCSFIDLVRKGNTTNHSVFIKFIKRLMDCEVVNSFAVLFP